ELVVEGRDRTEVVMVGEKFGIEISSVSFKLRDEEEETKVAKANEDIKLSIIKGKRKIVEDNGKGKEAEHHHLKVNKDDKGKGKGKLVEDNGNRKVHDIQNRVGSFKVDLARVKKAKQINDHDLDTFDLENKIKNLEEDFGRLLKANKVKESKKIKKANEAKKAKEVELAKKAKEAELKANGAKKAEEELKAKKDKEAKEAMLVELKAKKAKNAKESMLAEVV
nr:hypothetical protein [Tanacetum cinerariifolium]